MLFVPIIISSYINGSLNDVNNLSEESEKLLIIGLHRRKYLVRCGIYKINTIEDKFYNLISKNVTTFKNVGDYTLMIFSWNGLETFKL